VPRWRDRRELRQRLRAVTRQVRAETGQQLAANLHRLAYDRVPVTSLEPSLPGYQELSFADGAHARLALHGQPPPAAYPCRPGLAECYLANVEACSGYFWYWLQFLAPAERGFSVLARVEQMSTRGAQLWRPARRWHWWRLHRR